MSIALCDHPDIELILSRLIEMGYGISPASLRLDDLTETIVTLLRQSGERSITIAPETGSDRLRRVINKTVTNDEILDRAALIFRSGIENLKLYYMIGLPTETDEDLVAIRDLTLAIREVMVDASRSTTTIGRVVASVNPLIPKPGTTYQWLPMTDARVIEAKIERLRGLVAGIDNVLLQHQVGAAFVLPGPAVARRPPRRRRHRAGRAERRQLARRRRRGRPRRRRLPVPRPQPGRLSAVADHRRRLQDRASSARSSRRASVRSGRCRPSASARTPPSSRTAD